LEVVAAAQRLTIDETRLAADGGARPRVADPAGAHRAAGAAVGRIVEERRADSAAVAIGQAVGAASLGADSPLTDAARADGATRAAVVCIGQERGADSAAIAVGQTFLALGPLPCRSGLAAPGQQGGHGTDGKETERLPAGSAGRDGARNGVKGAIVHGVLPKHRTRAVPCVPLAPQGTPSPTQPRPQRMLPCPGRR
jgi:hypothetical protein